MAEQTHVEQMLQANPSCAAMDASKQVEPTEARFECLCSCTAGGDLSEDDPKAPTRMRKW